MKSITPQITLIEKVCREQKPAEQPYRETKHCLAVVCREGMLLYHTMTGEILLLTQREYTERMTDPVLREELIRHWFLVSTDHDEKKHADQIRKLALLLDQQKTGLNCFMVFTTLDCNARCFYCYELGRPRTVMSQKTALDVAAFIAGHCGGEEITLHWFGGEPLFNASAIDTIIGELSRRNIPYKSEMTSNGYLFDNELVMHAVIDWHLRFVQITLDGTEQVYNKAKAYIYREGSPYQRVIRNIGLLLDAGVYINIRLNMNGENEEDIAQLIEELGQRFRGRKGLSIYMALLTQFTNCSVRAFEDDAIALERMGVLTDRIRELGFARAECVETAVRRNNCMADNDRSIAILPDGRLGKCEHESEEKLIGSIYEDKLDEKEIAFWKDFLRCDDCEDCTAYPVCTFLKRCEWNAGGCSVIQRGKQMIFLKERVLKTYEEWKNKKWPRQMDKEGQTYEND